MLIYGLNKNSDKLVGINMNRKDRDSFKQHFNSDLVNIIMFFNICLLIFVY